MRILLSVGTHEQPFQRLLDAAHDAIAAPTGDEWVVQHGVGRWSSDLPGVLVAADYFDAASMQAHMEWADVVVSQSSPGLVFGALASGTWPLVLGRRASHGEHVDDHQVLFARELGRSGLAVDLEHPGALVGTLAAERLGDPAARRARCRTAAERSAANAERFRADVWRLLEDVA